MLKCTKYMLVGVCAGFAVAAIAALILAVIAAFTAGSLWLFGVGNDGWVAVHAVFWMVILVGATVGVLACLDER